MSKSLGYLVGGTRVPRKFGVGGSKFLGYRIIGPGVPNFLVNYWYGGAKILKIFGRGYQNS